MGRPSDVDSDERDSGGRSHTTVAYYYYYHYHY